MRKKIELEDIIGIVKTDEPTNSVKLKKEIYTDTENKRFEVVLNEFDEVEYIMDKEMMEDRDFAEFIDFVEDVCKENEQLQQELFESEEECLMINYNDNSVRRDAKIELLKEEFKERFGRDFE